MKILELVCLYIVALLSMNFICFLGNNVLFVLFPLLRLYRVYSVFHGSQFTVTVGKIKQLAGTFISVSETYR